MSDQQDTTPAWETISYWSVSVNNGQERYIVQAATAAGACVIAGDEWRSKATPRRLERGIYDVRASGAKFGQVRSAAKILRAADHAG